MFKVFISKSALIDIFLRNIELDDEEQETWYKIIKSQGCLYVKNDLDEDVDQLDEDNAQFSPSFLIEESGIHQEDCTDYINSIKSNPNVVLINPCSAFLLDIEKEEADKIQREYGVICQSTSNLKGKIWIKEKNNTYISLHKVNDNKHSWSQVFPSEEMPSNTLILIDRYLFTNREQGIFNVKQILNFALPKHFSKNYPYQILLIFDPTKIGGKVDFKKISTELNSVKKAIRIDRGYNIDLEVLGVTKDNYDYDDTHNRRIISNYYIIYAEHMLKAFTLHNNSLCSQVIRCDSLFHVGLDAGTSSDMPLSTHTEILTILKDLLEYAVNKAPKSFLFSSNGNSNLGVENVKNRLINCL